MRDSGKDVIGVEGTDLASTTPAGVAPLDWGVLLAAWTGVFAWGDCSTLISSIEMLSSSLGGESILVDLIFANLWCSLLSSFQLSFLYTAGGAANGEPASDMAADEAAELSYSEPE